jgi:two-component system response regulator RegA
MPLASPSPLRTSPAWSGRASPRAAADADNAGDDVSVLLLDEDAPARARLGRALEGFGLLAVHTDCVSQALAVVTARRPAFAVLETRLIGGSSLRVVDALRARRRDARIVMLTGFANIAAAVACVKAGAADYLAKPANPEDVFNALTADEGGVPPLAPEQPMSAHRVRWEHIHRVYELCSHNVSDTARRLRMSRRTLQRTLSKHAPR